MSKVISVKPHNASIGVIDKEVKIHEDLKEITFGDVFGTFHTVFAHVNGPFKTPEDVVKAFEDGVLHVFESHKTAIEHWAGQAGNEDLVTKLEGLAEAVTFTPTQAGGAY